MNNTNNLKEYYLFIDDSGKLIEENTALKIDYFIWPYKHYINDIKKQRDKEFEEIMKEIEELTL